MVLEEFQGLKKLLRKQSLLIEEVRREQEALAAEELRDPEPIMDLCDSVFYLHRAFQNPGLMSRQHAQVLNMVIKKEERFSAFAGMTGELSYKVGNPEAAQSQTVTSGARAINNDPGFSA